MSAPALRTITTTATPILPPSFAGTRRALIRLQAAHATRKVVDELISRPEPRHGHKPAFARLDELTDRYAALGGEPLDLLGRRRTFRVVSELRRGLQARYDEWLRRELDAGQTARAHRHETGGDFSVLP